jgi:hypothetical protein
MNDNKNIGYKIEVKTSSKKRGPKAIRPLSWILTKKNKTNFYDILNTNTGGTDFRKRFFC